ncbi:MAG: InlB B-repeat-containing protein [Oscillospiraceae bacterium]
MKNKRRTLKIWVGIALAVCLLGAMATSVFAIDKYNDTLTGFSIKVNGTAYTAAGNTIYEFEEGIAAFALSEPSITTNFPIWDTPYTLAYSFSESGPFTTLAQLFSFEHDYTGSFGVAGQNTVFLKVTLEFNPSSSLTIAFARAQAAPPPAPEPEPASSLAQPVANYRVMYDVNYDNLGTTLINDQTGYLAGQTVTLRPEAPARAGYTFVAWNTAANGSGTPYNPGNQLELHADVRLYAQWKKNISSSAAGAPAPSSEVASSSPVSAAASQSQSEASSSPASSAAAVPSQPAGSASQAGGNGGGSIFPWWATALVVLAVAAAIWLFVKKVKKEK